MAALTLAIDNAATARHPNDNAPADRTMPPATGSPRFEGAAVSIGDDDDFVLAILSRAHLMVERIAARRRTANIAKNRVETVRQLAKLPARVRSDLLQAEQNVTRTTGKAVRVERRQINDLDERHQTYSFD